MALLSEFKDFINLSIPDILKVFYFKKILLPDKDF